MPSDSMPPTSTPTPTMRWLANAVNVSSGWPNANVTGQPNDIVDTQKTFKLAVARKCRQYLPRSPNATASGLLNAQRCLDTQVAFKLAVARKCRQYLPRQPNATASGVLNDIFKSAASDLLDLTMRGKCFKIFSSWPNATTKGHLNEPIGIVSPTARCLKPNATAANGLLNDIYKYLASALLELTMLCKRINATYIELAQSHCGRGISRTTSTLFPQTGRGWVPARFLGRPMISSTFSPEAPPPSDATQERQCLANALNDAETGPLNDFPDIDAWAA
ncbi:hypothetical protein EV121DRAFT_285027 [Schizophyllum commune]